MDDADVICWLELDDIDAGPTMKCPFCDDVFHPRCWAKWTNDYGIPPRLACSYAATLKAEAASPPDD